MQKRIVFCLCSLIIACVLMDFVKSENNYSVELVEFRRRNDLGDAWVDWNTLYLIQIDRNKFLATGDIEVKKDIDDKQQLILEVYPLNPAKERGPRIFQVIKGFCKYIAEDEKTYPNLIKYSNLPPADQCPFAKGEYSLKDFDFETNFLPDNAPKGDYLVVVLLKDNAAFVAGAEIEITLE